MNFSDDVLKLNPGLAQSAAYRVKAERVIKLTDGFDSQLERDYASELNSLGYTVMREGWTFHLPGGVDYTPDFVAWMSESIGYHTGLRLIGNRKIFVYEVKGNLKQKKRPRQPHALQDRRWPVSVLHLCVGHAQRRRPLDRNGDQT